jgi:carbon-monoxide dehydrogenase medium subunit
LGELGEDGRILAGGQSLVPLMNFRLAQPEHVIDINPVSELAYIRRDDGRLAIGATARQAAVERSEETRREVPLLGEALGFVAHPPIRHRGTVVGSIAHADPAAELPCVAVALDAQITLASVGGSRTVRADDFFLGPFETALEPGELVTEVGFPVAAPGSGHAFVEFARRHGDFAIAGAAASVRLDEGRVADVAVALCSVGPRPHRARAAEEVLRGEVPGDDLVASAAEAAVDGLRPESDIHGGARYRIGLARTIAGRAILTALGRARAGERP